MPRNSVQGGWCPDLGYGNVSCVLEKTECPNENVFYSSRQIQLPGQIRSSCLDPKFVAEKSLGQCADGTCSPNAASCDKLGFYKYDTIDTCSIENTTFGLCGDRCLWSPDDCDNETWIFPSDSCSCDQVLVGACKKKEDIFCAVSLDACDDETTWLSPFEVVSTTDTRCYLCHEKPKGMYTPTPTPYDPVKKVNTEPSLGTMIIIGVATGVAIGAVMMIAVFLCVRKRQARACNDDEKKKTIPCASVVISKEEDISVMSEDISVVISKEEDISVMSEDIK